MAKLLGSVLTSAALIALSACATTPSPPGASAPRAAAAPTPPDSGTAYGYYLAGQAAMEAGDSQAAADYFAKARTANPDADFLKEDVFTASILAGDVTRAAETAPGPGEGTPSNQALGVLVQAVEALAQGDGQKAYAKLSAPRPPVAPVQDAAALLKPWAAAAAGKPAESVAMPTVSERLFRVVAALDQAELFEHARRYGEAETTFKALMVQKGVVDVIGPAYGVFLERRGRRKEAVALYDQIIADDPQDDSVIAARARAASKGTPPPLGTFKEGAAQTLLIQAEASLQSKDTATGLAYLRLVLRLDPDLDDAVVLAGDVLSTMGDTRSSRAAFEQLGPKSSRYVEARSRLAWSYQKDDQEQALKIARDTIAAKPDNGVALMTLAYLLRSDERYEESIKVLDPLIAGKGGRSDWRLYYMRGVALERTGRWPDAQRDFDKALSIKPDEPELLNYLGYSWVNRGEKVNEGLAMIRRAVDAQPDEGAFVDSLGWAYYRLGNYKDAVQALEQAVSLEAGDAEINDHLGDAYWRVGRRDEARFQWSAVLTLKPDADVKARVETKLASPLGPDGVAKDQKAKDAGVRTP